MTVVVATEDFELYHGVVNELRDRGVRFTTIRPDEPLPDGASVVVTGANDDVDGDGNVAVVVGQPADPRRTVEDVLAVTRGGEGRRIVGIDPGDRPGVAVLAGDDVVAAFQVPLGEVPELVRREVGDAVDPIVRIGDGARLRGATLVEDLDDVRVELVDESGSTPHLGAGTRGMGDVLAAVNIARREGEPVEGREIEPTAGEIQVIKTAARERSPENRAIPEGLARRVAKGDLTLDDALAEHRSG